MTMVSESELPRESNRGSYRSAFTFHDIDGDGQEEAIVLHSPRSGGNDANRGALQPPFSHFSPSSPQILASK